MHDTHVLHAKIMRYIYVNQLILSFAKMLQEIGGFWSKDHCMIKTLLQRHSDIYVNLFLEAAALLTVNKHNRASFGEYQPIGKSQQ